MIAEEQMHDPAWDHAHRLTTTAIVDSVSIVTTSVRLEK